MPARSKLPPEGNASLLAVMYAAGAYDRLSPGVDRNAVKLLCHEARSRSRLHTMHGKLVLPAEYTATDGEAGENANDAMRSEAIAVGKYHASLLNLRQLVVSCVTFEGPGTHSQCCAVGPQALAASAAEQVLDAWKSGLTGGALTNGPWQLVKRLASVLPAVSSLVLRPSQQRRAHG